MRTSARTLWASQISHFCHFSDALLQECSTQLLSRLGVFLGVGTLARSALSRHWHRWKGSGCGYRGTTEGFSCLTGLPWSPADSSICFWQERGKLSPFEKHSTNWGQTGVSHMCWFPVRTQAEGLSAQVQCHQAIRKTGRRGHTFFRAFLKSTTVLCTRGLWTPKVRVSVKHASIKPLPAVKSTTWKGISHNSPALITLDNQTIIFYCYQEVSMECASTGTRQPILSTAAVLSQSQRWINVPRALACSRVGMCLCTCVSIIFVNTLQYLGISLEMSCYLTTLSLRKPVFWASWQVSKGQPAQKGEITFGTLTHPDSSRSHSLSHPWLERPVIKHRWLDTRIKPYYTPCIYHSRPIINEQRRMWLNGKEEHILYRDDYLGKGLNSLLTQQPDILAWGFVFRNLTYQVA